MINLGAKKQIDTMVILGKQNETKHIGVCLVILLVKKDESHRFCGDYRPSNMQTHWYSFPMALVENVLTQLGKS